MDFESIKAWFNELLLAINEIKKFYDENKDIIHASIEAFIKLPERLKTAGDEWVKYGWVPFLPNSDLGIIAEALDYPKTQNEADNRMLNLLNNCTYDVLFQGISDLITDSENKMQLFEESVFCFNNQKYTSCVLNIFAIIDICFLENQPKESKDKNRKLPGNAFGKMFGEEKTDDSNTLLYITVGIIKETYKNGKDFSIEENKLNRNFVSHGMNKRKVTKTDCEKMYVLLYNVLALFQYGLLNWEKSENNQFIQNDLFDENIE